MSLEKKAKKQKKSPVHNFDFGKHWHQVLPFIRVPEFEEKVKEVWRLLDKDGVLFGGTVYDASSAPAQYLHCRTYAYGELLMKLAQQYTRSKKKLYALFQGTAEFDIISSFQAYIDEETGDGEVVDETFKLHEMILKRLGYDYTTNKDQLAFYFPIGICHWWNPIISKWIAERMFPNDKWVVRKSSEHTTIYCAAKHIVFDMCYWAIDGRIDDYVLGQPFGESSYRFDDATLGGNQAFEMSDCRKYPFKRYSPIDT